MKRILLILISVLGQKALSFGQDSVQVILPQTDTVTQIKNLSFNPEIGVIGDFRGSYISKGERNFDAYMEESEFSFRSTVDPYIRADFFVSVARDPFTNEFGIGLEEGYLTTLTLPARLQLKAGKFKQSAGRLNTLHGHALPFVDMPIAFSNYYGEGLSDEGISLSWMTPVNSFYQELVFETTSGNVESPVFRKSERNRFLYLAHLKNVFTLNDNSTFELGLTGISGPNEFDNVTNIGAADLTYKWKPVQYNTYHSLTWQTEFFAGRVGDSTGDYRSLGLYSYIEYQLSRRWFINSRYDFAQDPYYDEIKTHALSFTATWQATEFQKLQFETKRTENNIQSATYECWLRWVFIIGAHGAHQY